MNLWRYILVCLLIVFFIAFALVNDDSVKVHIYLNLFMEGGLEFIYLPIYLIVFFTLFFGVVVGIFIEHLRYVRLRNLMRLKESELIKMKMELQKNKEKFFSEEEKIMDMLN